MTVSPALRMPPCPSASSAGARADEAATKRPRVSDREDPRPDPSSSAQSTLVDLGEILEAAGGDARAAAAAVRAWNAALGAFGAAGPWWTARVVRTIDEATARPVERAVPEGERPGIPVPVDPRGARVCASPDLAYVAVDGVPRAFADSGVRAAVRWDPRGRVSSRSVGAPAPGTEPRVSREGRLVVLEPGRASVVWPAAAETDARTEFEPGAFGALSPTGASLAVAAGGSVDVYEAASEGGFVLAATLPAACASPSDRAEAIAWRGEGTFAVSWRGDPGALGIYGLSWGRWREEGRVPVEAPGARLLAGARDAWLVARGDEILRLRAVPAQPGEGGEAAGGAYALLEAARVAPGAWIGAIPWVYVGESDEGSLFLSTDAGRIYVVPETPAPALRGRPARRRWSAACYASEVGLVVGLEEGDPPKLSIVPPSEA